MRIDAIKNSYTPTFRQNNAVVAYPELSYRKSQINVYETDPFENGFSSIVKKFEKAYRLLFTPEIDKKSADIKNSIDLIVDGEKQDKSGAKLNAVA